jgi:hypothetical protein
MDLFFHVGLTLLEMCVLLHRDRILLVARVRHCWRCFSTFGDLSARTRVPVGKAGQNAGNSTRFQPRVNLSRTTSAGRGVGVEPRPELHVCLPCNRRRSRSTALGPAITSVRKGRVVDGVRPYLNSPKAPPSIPHSVRMGRTRQHLSW